MDNDSEVRATIQEIIVAEDGIEYYFTGENGHRYSLVCTGVLERVSLAKVLDVVFDCQMVAVCRDTEQRS